MVSLSANPYIRPDNFQQLQRKPDYIETMYTEQEFIEMLNQEMEERGKEELKEHSVYNWANRFNQRHPDLAGTRCFYVNGAWHTPEEVQKIWVKEFEEERRKSEEYRKQH